MSKILLSGPLTVLIIIFVGSVYCQRSCLEKQQRIEKEGISSNSSYPCCDICTGKFIVDQEDCLKSKQCYFENNTCILKQLSNKLFLDIENKTSEQFLNQSVSDGKFLNIGGGFDITQVQLLFPDIPICAPFPENCKLNFNSPDDLQPPINIPYCQRIACRPDNPFLEEAPDQCLSIPGCGFDLALFQYRSTLGFAVLPGVPVCHLAIRNEVFLKNASDFLNKTGEPWNPLLTRCLIDELHNEIFELTHGCAKISVLQEFGYKAKQAGWIGISSRECHLINGCWLNNQCLYPVSSEKVKTLSKNGSPHPDHIIHGRPQCRPFDDDLKNENFLDAYHSCMRSGCYSDIDDQQLFHHLFGIADSLPKNLRFQFKKMVLSGETRVDNYKEVISQLLKDRLLYNNTNSESNELLIQAIFGVSGSIQELPLFLIDKSNGTNHTFPPDSILFNVNENLPFVPPNLNLVSKISRPCPYQPLNFPFFLPLLGSFEGCCETSNCYLPRSDLRVVHSEVASYEVSWTAWSPCSSTCGKGIQKRTRICIGERCPSAAEQSQICNTFPCKSLQHKATYSSWSSYGPCSVSCGGGFQKRTRNCSKDKICTRPLEQLRRCKTGRCPSVRKGQWSACTQTCGIGTQSRRLICEKPGDYRCPKTLFERRSCTRYCGHIKFTDSPCSKSTCFITRIGTCVQGNGLPGFCRQRSNLRTRRKCYVGDCLCFHNPRHQQCKNGKRIR